MNMPLQPPLRQGGFTLIEAIVSMVVMGILVAIVATIMRLPFVTYMDASRRSDMTEVADTALRRLSRDVHLALPNSLRVTQAGNVNTIEFIMTSGGGRYRDMGDGQPGNPLDFTNTAATSFDVVGPMPQGMAVGDSIVVFNIGDNPGNAYGSGPNRAAISAIAGNTVTLSANPFAAQSPPLPSPNNRFQVVPASQQAVAYTCPAATSNTACPQTNAGQLNRYWKYGFNGQTGAGSSAMIADHITCSVNYTSNPGATRSGLLSITLNVSSSAGQGGGDCISLFREIHVDNTP